MAADLAPENYWSRPAAELLDALSSRAVGLSEDEARQRLARIGPNSVEPRRELAAWRLLLRQFSSPLVLILVAGALISLFVADWTDAAVILFIVAGSTLLGFWQEYRASTAIAQLRGRLALTVRALRDGATREIDAHALVPGDVIMLSAGNLVPADGVILAARDFLVVEASLTGESFPVEKAPGVADSGAPLRSRGNCVFLGSSVRSGTATVLVAATGRATALGEVGGRLAQPVPESDFARGARRFGEMLLRVMLVVVVAVLVANAMLGRPVIESMLFAVALAVGLSPELLPAIISVSLARGAGRLAGLGVMVRRLDAIEDLGGIDILCTDKTGTLTRGTMALQAAVDADGADSAEVMRLAWLNASLETGIANPIDEAIVAAGRERGLASAGVEKRDEIPYDFVRKRLTLVVAEQGGGVRLITKGAFAQVLAVCATARRAGAAG
jgi:Mg2+-importing ATPase